MSTINTKYRTIWAVLPFVVPLILVHVLGPSLAYFISYYWMEKNKYNSIYI